jgi:hypothetical protein
MRLDDLLRRVDELIAYGEDAMRHVENPTNPLAVVKPATYAEFKSASQSFLDRTFGSLSAYANHFRIEVMSPATYNIDRGLGILRGARGELAGGWLRTTRGLLSAELFGDFWTWPNISWITVTRMPQR